MAKKSKKKNEREMMEVLRDEQPLSVPTQKRVISCEFFEGQVRDVFRKPRTFFSTASSFEEGLTMLITLRDFTDDGNSNFIEHKRKWIETHFPSKSGVMLYKMYDEDYDLVYVLMASIVKSYDPILFAEMEP